AAGYAHGPWRDVNPGHRLLRRQIDAGDDMLKSGPPSGILTAPGEERMRSFPQAAPSRDGAPA
ncbi:MAG TPA: hypothetical protein VIL69_13420, partial [Roseomonas sp.]